MVAPSMAPPHFIVDDTGPNLASNYYFLESLVSVSYDIYKINMSPRVSQEVQRISVGTHDRNGDPRYVTKTPSFREGGCYEVQGLR